MLESFSLFPSIIDTLDRFAGRLCTTSKIAKWWKDAIVVSLDLLAAFRCVVGSQRSVLGGKAGTIASSADKETAWSTSLCS